MRPLSQADRFLDDLARSVGQVKKFGCNKLANSLTVDLVQAAGKLLPARLMSALTARASAMMESKGGGLPKRSAAMYGMVNRERFNTLVTVMILILGLLLLLDAWR